MHYDEDQEPDYSWMDKPEKEPEPEPKQRICPDCKGSALSPYPEDGGSCPHCFGGYVRY